MLIVLSPLHTTLFLYGIGSPGTSISLVSHISMQPFSQHKFTVRDILRHEAEALSKHGPSRSKPQEPECGLDPFTRLHDLGAGVCRVKRWPDDVDPYAWGCRNESLLLDEPICSPARWEVEEAYRGNFRSLLGPIDYSYMEGVVREDDEGYEEQFLVVLDNILRRVASIAFVFLVQLWRRNPEYGSHPDYHIAFEALHRVIVQQIRTSQRMSPQSRGVAVMAPRTTSTGKYDHLVIGTVQRTGFAERIHTANEHDCRTTDEVLSSILDDDADQDTNNLFMKFGPHNDWQSVAVGHIVQVQSTIFCTLFYQPLFTQMSHIASLCTSRMGLSTSIWGYLRFFIQIDSTDGRTPTLYITRNMGINTAWDDNSRTDKLSNFKLVCHIYYFVILVLLQTQGPRILPPDLRENDSLLFFFSSTMNKPTNFFSCCRFLPRLALTRISGHLRSILFNLLAASWELVLHCCSNRVIEDVGFLRIEFVEGKLERVSEDGRIKGYATHSFRESDLCLHSHSKKTLYLRFDSWDIRDVTEVGISRRAGLVLKIFHTRWMFEAELRAYLAIQEVGVQFIPQFLGVFNVPGTKGAILLTMVGETNHQPFTLDDR